MYRSICKAAWARSSLLIRRLGGLLKRQLIVIATNKGQKNKAIPVYVVTSPLTCKTFFYLSLVFRSAD